MIAIGSDHAGFKLKEVIKEYLKEKGLEFKDYGTFSKNRRITEYGERLQGCIRR